MSPDPPVEVEVKARAEDLERVREQLEDRGGRRVATWEQTDIYYGHPHRNFAQTDEALRIRETGGRVEATYKGPKLDGETKTREEITVELDDAASAGDLLEALGFAAAGRVVKQREVYELGELTVTLDQVEGLGPFVEIEHVVDEGIDEARETVLELADELGLEDLERRSYLELLLEGDGGTT